MTKEEIIAKMKADMELRNRSIHTQEYYLRMVRVFQEHFDKPADQMGENEIAEYLHYLLTVKKSHPNTVNMNNSAFRFLYGVTLDIVLNIKKFPRIKHSRSLPDLLTKEEIQRIVDCGSKPIHKVMFLLAYGSGLRLSEITNLKVSDIDSQQMRIFVRKGKGGRDRFALLPQTTLESLREYWLKYRPTDWLFVAPNAGGRYLGKTLEDAFNSAVKRAGIQKDVSIHTLRHCFATHLFNEGNNLYAIKKLMGHVRIDTTTWYTQLADSSALKSRSPLDSMPKKRGRKPKAKTGEAGA